MAALHSPAELVLAAFCGGRSAPDWDWLKWLPHTRNPEGGEGLGRAIRAVTADQAAFYVDLMKKVQATPEWKEYVERTSQTNVFLTGDAFTKFMTDDIEHVRKVAADQGWLVAN